MRKSTATILLSVFTTVAMVSFPPPRPASAEVDAALGAATGVLGALTVGKIFDKINHSIDAAEATAESGGNRLMFTGVDQMRQLLKQLQAEMDKEIGTVFNNLSDQRKLAIWDLYSVSKHLESGAADEFAKGMVEVSTMLANIRFIGKDLKFVIFRVTPTVFQQNDTSSTPVALYGVGIGTDQAFKKITRNIKIGQKQIPDDKLSVKEWGVEVFLQKADFNGYWKSDEYTHVPMTVQSAVTEPGSWWCNWMGCKSTNTYSAKYDIDLYPTKGADITIVSKAEQEVPEGTEQVERLSVTLPNMDGQGHLSSTISSPPVSAGEHWKWDRWDSSKDGCSNISGEGCPFVRHQSCHFSGDRFTAQCSADNDGHSCTYQFGVIKKLYKMTEVGLPDTKLALHPNESKIIEVDSRAKVAWIEGVLPTSNKFGPISLIPPAGNALDPVVCTGGITVGDKNQFTCSMHEPL